MSSSVGNYTSDLFGAQTHTQNSIYLQELLMNRNFKRTAFIWKEKINNV